MSISTKKLDEVIRQVEFLKNELRWFSPLDENIEKELWQKVCLDMNFHSSKMGGIKITVEQTQRLMLTTGSMPGKKVRSSTQVVGHDEALAEVRNYAHEQRPISESFIRGLHKILIKDEFYNDAITLDQKPTKKIVIPGDYKEQPNWFMKNGKIHSYATPEATPGLMTDLIDWCKAEMESRECHPLLLAAEFHFRFIRIHPFDDGNGRTARLLVNYILLYSGLPPVVIDNKHKDAYIEALNNGDRGNLEEFKIFLGERLIDSFKLYLDAARGGRVQTGDDLKKRVLLLTKKLEGNYMRTARSNQGMVTVLKNVYKPLLHEVNRQIDLVKHLFVDSSWHFFEEPKPPKYGVAMMPMTWTLHQIIDHHIEVAVQGQSYHQFKVMNWLTHLRSKNEKVSVEVAFKIYFYEFEYEIIAYVGMPYESSMFVKSFKNFISVLTEEEDEDFIGFDYSVCKLDYATFPVNEDLVKFGEQVGHQLVNYIEDKTKLNPHKTKSPKKNKFRMLKDWRNFESKKDIE